MRPDPAKVNTLKYISPPSNKDDLMSFLSMMQSNADFIEKFTQKATPLRELTQNKTNFKACVHYFLRNFYFSPNDSPSKTMKDAFYFI